MGGVTNTGGSETKTYTPTELALLERYFSPSTPREHGDIYLVRNLPQEVAATLNGVYSRSSLSMRDNFLERLKKGLAATGKDLDSIEVPPTQADLLTSVMADKAGQFLKTYAIDHGAQLAAGRVLCPPCRRERQPAGDPLHPAGAALLV